jgi:lactate dehydrogenase-like 2-hydroxyacid dehydrogenase
VADIEVLKLGNLPKPTEEMLKQKFTVRDASQDLGAVRAIARGTGKQTVVDAALIERLPRLEIIANFGVGYDGIDLAGAAKRGIVVTNTPDVLTEEVADIALALLLMTVRELSAAERYLRAGKWASEGPYPLTGTLRDRRVGIAGLGRIGLAVARRLDAMAVPVVYHTRQPKPDVPYPYFADLHAMAVEVDTLMCILPGGEATRNQIDARILRALGANGVLINIGRGTSVDEPALIAALKNKTIRAAGLDVFAEEPRVPAELIAMENVVLLPHVGSASVYTRAAMGQLMFDNLASWFDNGRPLTPVPETPFPPKKAG